MKFYRGFVLSVFFSLITLNVQAQIRMDKTDDSLKKSLKILKIIEEQPEAIEDWVGDKMYINPQRIVVTRQGAFLSQNNSNLSLPPFNVDQKGIFIITKSEDVNQEAQDHYDKAKEALIDALGHSAAAGLGIVEVPPLGIYERYRAVESWKEAAREYNAGVECEARGTYTPPEPKSGRDD